MTASRARTAVIALGGNALAPAGEKSTIHDQFRHARESLGPIVDLVADGWNVCVVHGNGPQVGDELVRNEIARREANPLPLGVLVAATAGWIGYMVQQSLENALRRAGSARDVATVITVTDDGPGIPAEFQGSIFSRFTRADTARSGWEGSSGLGLSIVESIVAAHGGTVELVSRPGRTEFAVRLPAAGPART